MSSAKATLGYPSRTDAVLALRAEGHSQHEIAKRIGIPTSTVSALECSARRRGGVSTGVRNHGEVCRTVHIPIGVLQQIAPDAARRGLSRETLAALIVEKVAEDRLVDAVLDDSEETD